MGERANGAVGRSTHSAPPDRPAQRDKKNENGWDGIHELHDMDVPSAQRIRDLKVREAHARASHRARRDATRGPARPPLPANARGRGRDIQVQGREQAGRRAAARRPCAVALRDRVRQGQVRSLCAGQCAGRRYLQHAPWRSAQLTAPRQRQAHRLPAHLGLHQRRRPVPQRQRGH